MVRLEGIVPKAIQTSIGPVLVLAVILLGTFLSPESQDNNYKNRGISLVGLALTYALLYLTSSNRLKIVWRTVIVGLLSQYLLALFVLRTQVGFDIFDFVSSLAR